MSNFQHNQTHNLLSVGEHALNRSEKNAIPVIEAQAPKPPIWKQKQLYPYAAVALLVLGVIALDIYMRIETYSANQQLAELEAEFVDKLKLKRQADSLNSQGKTLETQVDELTSQLNKNKSRRDVLKRLLYQQELIPGVLKSIQKAMTDDVIIEQVIQNTNKQNNYYIRGWAMTNTSGQLLVNNLERELKQLNLRVQDSNLNSSTGRNGSDGYKVEIWLSLDQKAVVL